MATTFQQTYKLANLLSAMSATVASIERSFSTQKRIAVRKDLVAVSYQYTKPYLQT
jgi:hypothetical protein